MFKIPEICTLYNLSYDSRNPLSQFPVFVCQSDDVGDPLITYLMQELNGRLTMTPLNGYEATKSIYIYTFLYAIAKSISTSFRVLPERYIEGLKAKGNADYSVELEGGRILGVTEVKREDYLQGIAQNAIQISRKGKKLICLVSGSPQWYFLKYTPDHPPCVSKRYSVVYDKGEAAMKDITTITGTISWLLKGGLEEYTEFETPNKKTDNVQVAKYCRR